MTVVSRAPRLIALVLVGLAAACGREAREPVEVDLTEFGVVLAEDGTRRPVTVETAGRYRRLVEPAGAELDFVVRLPADARLRFTLDPQTPPEAFAISRRSDGAARPVRVRSLAAGDWEASIDGEEGSIVRLRLENRGTRPLRWWSPRLVGTTRVTGPILGASLRPKPGPLNVIVLLVDALRADHLSLLGYRRETTPELERLAARHGLVFEHAYSAGPSTPNSIPSLFTARYASALGINFRATTGGTDRTLAEVLSRGGVRTAAFVANPLLREAFGYGRGFGHYEIVRSTEETPAYPHVATLVDRALEYVSVNRDTSCFVYLHAMDVHTPFEPPPPFRGRFADDGLVPPARPARWPESERVLASMLAAPGPWLIAGGGFELNSADEQTRYDESLASVDAEIGRLVRGLDALGLGDRTAIVVTADHGEALGTEDDGRFLHGHALYEELVHVPLVALLPWLEGERRVIDVMSLVDVAPTLVDMVGLAPPESFAGTSLFRPGTIVAPPLALFERLDAQWTTSQILGPGRFGVAEWGVREGRWKLLMDDARIRLFDLPSDPKEIEDVAAANPDMTAYLADLVARRSPAITRRERVPLVDPSAGDAPSLTEALKALGYIQ